MGKGSVQWAYVASVDLELLDEEGLQRDNGKVEDDDFGVRIGHCIIVEVPFGTLHRRGYGRVHQS